MGFWEAFGNGLGEGFGSMGTELRRIFFGYDMNRPEDKAAKEALEKVAANDGKLDSGGLIITNPNAPSSDSSMLLLIVGAIVFIFLALKD